MEKPLIQDNKLHVCVSHYIKRMDELTEDFNTALDNSFSLLMSSESAEKTRSWKHTSPSKCVFNPTASFVVKSSALSEDSCSSFSLDNKIQFQRDFSTNGSHHQSDSDEISTQQNYQLRAWRHCATNIGESDSVNENFHACRTPRRKRKFKRMSVDPPSIVDHDFQILAQKTKRFRNFRSQKLSKISSKCNKFSKLTASQLSVEMENICRSFATAACGKRKRCSHERNPECHSYDCKDFVTDKIASDETSDSSNLCHHTDFHNGITRDFSSTDISSSESECDEHREADDELSDFFQELGPTYGVPYIPATLLNPECSNDADMLDSSFQPLISDVLQNKSEERRVIRSGRRRLEKMVCGVENGNSKTQVCIAFPAKNEYQCLPIAGENYVLKVPSNDTKRRKQMSPLMNFHGYEDIATPVSESSINFRLLKNMGWKPGMCLNLTGSGVVSPAKSVLGREKEELEFNL
ncbi:uncharacterized protein LOC129219014 [Uloborus diversus]|uniref:uncharacterized protein LOC129219014 n=1 Tax=Uloborus diversus TaxID=327109 RepID=UPI0024097D76|nr:uncharacterized protein LOC129219014 [Uloborus diversus]